MSDKQPFGQWKNEKGLQRGRIYLVSREEDNQQYVLKRRGNKNQKISNEVEVLQRLEGHSNIATLTDYNLDCPDPYLVMPYYAGGRLDITTFRDWTLEQLQPKALQQLLSQVAKGLGYMHSQGVTHGDIQRHNIVLKEDRTPVVIDFGTAKIWNGYYPDTENDVQRFGRLYQRVMRDCKAVRMPKLEERRQREIEQRWEENSQPHPPRQLA